MYKIVSSTGSTFAAIAEMVENQVNELKQQGWVEQGGVSVSSRGSNDLYVVAQAMVKNE